MNTATESRKANEHVSFQRDHIIRKFKLSDIPTPDDSDRIKIPLIEKLLLKMYEFVRELETVNIELQEDKEKYTKYYLLTIPDYSNHCRFEINLRCNWFNVKESFALHAGFDFFLYINQEIHPEISDWIRIHIKHFNTIPFSYASEREYSGNQYLRSFYHGKKFFDNFMLGPEQGRSRDGFTFKTDAFDKSVGDTCLLLDYLIANKKIVKILTKKE